MFPGIEEHQFANQLASDWMHQGMDLAKENTSATLERAIRCFDEAIALRRRLPLEQNHFFRYGLSAGWINRGDAMARLGGDSAYLEALKSYDEALLLLRSLPLEENPLYPRRLAITWINRGQVLLNQNTFSTATDSAHCFREAVQVLQHDSADSILDRGVLLGGAWTNLANAFVNGGESSDEIGSAIRQALDAVRPSEQVDCAAAEVGFKARHLLCQFIVRCLLEKKEISKSLLNLGMAALDEALVLGQIWHAQGIHDFTSTAREIFRFGCSLYEMVEPQLLANFLLTALSSESPFFFDQEIFEAALASCWSVLEKLQPSGFESLSAPVFQTFLHHVEQLQKVETRLYELQRLVAFQNCKITVKNRQPAVSA